MSEIGCFDHSFFRMSPREAASMDPQQEVLLEAAHQAMESSGYLGSHRREAGDPVGVFLGASFVEYLDNTSANPPTAYTSTGTIRAFLSGKISYHFGWTGPSEILDTACWSSLVAINRACKAIQNDECPIALTGGINLITGIHNYLDIAKAGFLSPPMQAIRQWRRWLLSLRGCKACCFEALEPSLNRSRPNTWRHPGAKHQPRRFESISHSSPQCCPGKVISKYPPPSGNEARAGLLLRGSRHRHPSRRSIRSSKCTGGLWEP